MDEPTDPLARQMALSASTAEHFNLQTARMGTIAEANGRSTLYLGTLSSAVIAHAFIGQASQLGGSPLQMLLTAASMVACINAIVGGVTVALAVRSLLDASVPVAAVTGAGSPTSPCTASNTTRVGPGNLILICGTHARRASNTRTGREIPSSRTSPSSTKATPWGEAVSTTLWVTRT
jgi:hypothetical protein